MYGFVSQGATGSVAEQYIVAGTNTSIQGVILDPAFTTWAEVTLYGTVGYNRYIFNTGGQSGYFYVEGATSTVYVSAGAGTIYDYSTLSTFTLSDGTSREASQGATAVLFNHLLQGPASCNINVSYAIEYLSLFPSFDQSVSATIQ
jgi:hypothetical protein